MSSDEHLSLEQCRAGLNTEAPGLKDLQADFKRHLIHKDDAIARHIVSTQKLANDTRLAIYSNAYYARLAEALEKDYVSISVLLGDDAFYQLCVQYIDTFPSIHPSLRWFGRHMAGFLTSTAPYNALPYLAELAVFEWMFITVFDSPDDIVATELDAAQVPPEKWPTLRVKLHPSVHWLPYQWNILPLWRATNAKEGAEAPIPVPTLLDREEQCVVWRQGLSTQYRTLDQDEAILLSCAANGGNFSQMCEALVGLVEDPNELPMRAASILKSWLSSEMIARLESDTEN